MLNEIVARPEASVLRLPVAGQRSSVVRYLTMAQTSKFTAGCLSRRNWMTTLSREFWAGVASDTLTLEPTNRSAVPGRGVAVGTAVAGAGVTVVSITRRDELDRGRTFCSALRADRLNDKRGRMMNAPIRLATMT